MSSSIGIVRLIFWRVDTHATYLRLVKLGYLGTVSEVVVAQLFYYFQPLLYYAVCDLQAKRSRKVFESDVIRG